MLYAISKRTFDILGAFTGLLILLPLLLLIAAYVKRKSPGPVLYLGSRIGRYGKPFTILKFRSMVVGAELLGGSATADDDPRLTGAGKVLRKYKLDELPQLFNVLIGNMSLVGPRPEVEKYVNMYSESEKRLLQLLPGVTDWATLWNSNEGTVLAGSPDPEKTYEELIRPTKLRLQLLYLEQRSMLTDVQILFHTAIKLIQRDWLPAAIAAYDPPGMDRRCSEAGPVLHG